MNFNSANVAVIGCGYWGKNLVRNFRNLKALGAGTKIWHFPTGQLR